MSNVSHEFDKVSFDWENYNLARPQYPAQLFDIIFSSHAENGGGFERALDCGCGSGNVLQQWAYRFEEVHALDFQTNSILLEELRSKVVPHEGPAEDLKFLADGSVDFVGAAAAAHWFDRSLWLPEVARVLKPGGTLALWSHHPLPFDCDASRKLHDLYKDYVFKSLQGLLKTEAKSPGPDNPAVQGYSHGLSEAFEPFEFSPEHFKDVHRISWNRPSEYSPLKRSALHERHDLRSDPRFMSEEIDYERLRHYHKSLSNFEEKWLQADPSAKSIIDEEWVKIKALFDECAGKRGIHWPCFLVVATRN